MPTVANNILGILQRLGAQPPIHSGSTMNDLNMVPATVEQEINVRILRPRHKRLLNGEVTTDTTVQALVLLTQDHL